MGATVWGAVAVGGGALGPAAALGRILLHARAAVRVTAAFIPNPTG